MKIYLLDTNHLIIKAWQKYFNNEANIEIVHDNFKHFMDEHKVDCVVSPGNSKGIMAGGYDYAISQYFGWELTENVQKYITNHFNGLQPIGSAFLIDIPKSKTKLIHCPTMVEPCPIKDTNIIFKCIVSTLCVATDNNINTIVIPAFGGLTGKVNPDELAKLMYLGYKESI